MSDAAGAVTGRAFYKMTGSGNDFLIFDARGQELGALEDPRIIKALCARGTGVGADGVVLLENSQVADLRMRYFNADGSPGELCGNASLCCTSLAGIIGAAPPGDTTIESDSGLLRCRVTEGIPEIDLQVILEVQPDYGVEKSLGEQRIGFALVGVPHLVVMVDDLERVDMLRRAPFLRHHPSLAKGANVNFVARDREGWAYRTFERGVEGETLACGSGAVATAVLLSSWDGHTAPRSLRTRSGKELKVTLQRSGLGWLARLRGEGRLVFTGALGELE
jgi:diaminopimelate epimerase